MCVTERVLDPSIPKTTAPQAARITFAAGSAVGFRIITAVGDRKIDAELFAFSDNLRFIHCD
jgi:hypothetical protein